MDITALGNRIAVLEAESDIRRLQNRYMFLCDTPCPEFGADDDEARIDLIMELYADDAVWEGVGQYYTSQFGQCVGAAAIRAHFTRFWGEKSDPALVLNAHYLCSEQIHVHGDHADGQWIHMQPWIFADGTGILRSSRLNNAFARRDGHWLITRTRTENVFVCNLPQGVASAIGTISVLMNP